MPDKTQFYAPLERAASPGLESTYGAAESFYGYLPDYILSMSRLPLAVEAYTIFLTELYDEVTLPNGLAQLISMQASIVSQCNYSIAHAAKLAHDAGVPSEKIAALSKFDSSELFDESERAALEFASKSAQAPSTLDQVDFDHMASWFSETQICEIVFIVAQTGFHNRWNDAVATQLETAPRTYAEDTLGEQWTAGKHA